MSVMENTDRQIVALLARDGRMSYTEIGKQTGLSTSAAQQRVRRLEQRGVIDGYVATVNYAELGFGLSAFVEVTPLDHKQPDDFPDRLAKLPEVVSCYSIAGNANYLLRVQVGAPGDLENLLFRIRNEGLSTTTTIVLSVPYEGRPIDMPPVDEDGEQ